MNFTILILMVILPKGFNIRVDNNIGGDPYYGIEKKLEIYFLLDNVQYIIVADENRNLKFEL